jgi:hypothetical protein
MSALVNQNHSSLLLLVQQACSELGLAAPDTVVGNPDLQVTQLLALANREGREMFARGVAIGGWQMLRKEQVFNVQSTGVFSGSYALGSNQITMVTVPATLPVAGWVLSNAGSANASAFPYPTTVLSVVGSVITVSNNASFANANTSMAFGQDTYTMPTDIDHLIPQTFWDRSFRWQLLGPLSPQEWQVLKSGISPTGPRRRFRIMGGSFVVDPVPSDTNQLVYEYYSLNWCQSSGHSGRPALVGQRHRHLCARRRHDGARASSGAFVAPRASNTTPSAEWEACVDRILARQASARARCP